MLQCTTRYLAEFRRRLLRCLGVLVVLFIILSFYANAIYSWIAKPLLIHLNAGAGLIATSLVSPLLIPYKAAFMFSLYITAPYFLYECWKFISPALYRHERKPIWFLSFSSAVLFYLGTLFAYFILLPWIFKFILYTAPANVEIRPEMGSYLSFVMQTLFGFGVAFQLPIIMLTLSWLNFLSPAQLSRARPYVIVGAFIVGMLLTPPDVISQIMLAVPLWCLYEIGLCLAKFFASRAQKPFSAEMVDSSH